MPERLKGFRVAILATDFFEESELVQPRQALEQAGATTVVIAPHSGEIKGAHHNKEAKPVKVEMTLAEADPQNFDALLLPGGSKNAAALRHDSLAQDFARFMDQSRRPIAVICHGGWLLISAHLVKGRHLTSYSAIAEDFARAGAFWVDQPVVRDSNLISSRQPADIPQFNEAMLSYFMEVYAHMRAAA